MEGYLGEFPTDTCSNWTRSQFALQFIERYCQIDGGHHKQWVLDQVTRILLRTPVIATLAKWEGGYTELRYHTGEPDPAYLAWVRQQRGAWSEKDGYEYSYDEGIAP